MEFCPKCGGMMLPFKEEIIIEDENETGYSDERYIEHRPSWYYFGTYGGKVVLKEYLRCNSCGYTKDISEDTKDEYYVGKKVESEDTVIMIEDERGVGPTTKEPCPKCGEYRVFRDIRQVKGIAEGPTIFFRCKKCGHTWRDQ